LKILQESSEINLFEVRDTAKRVSEKVEIFVALQYDRGGGDQPWRELTDDEMSISDAYFDEATKLANKIKSMLSTTENELDKAINKYSHDSAETKQWKADLWKDPSYLA